MAKTLLFVSNKGLAKTIVPETMAGNDIACGTNASAKNVGSRV
jgi:hypothetical protein